MKSFFLTMLISVSAIASGIEVPFQAHDYAEVVRTYEAESINNFNTNELVMISSALRHENEFRQDVELNLFLIEQDFKQQNQTLLATIKKGDTIDPEEYSNPLKIHYWMILLNYSNLVKEHSKDSPDLKKDSQHFNDFYKILSALEFRESEVEKLNDTVAGHLQYLENKVYHFTSSISFQYVSWQQESKLVSATTSTGLITTNKGYCGGGEAGLENRYFHYYMDGCFLFGSGGVAAPASTDITYQQSSIPAYGFKGGPGASMIVSSSGSRLGIKVPIIYSSQKLTDPSEPGYKIVQDSPLSVLVSLYSRWQFDKWYVQTEFGKYLKKEQTFWGLGLGKKF